MSSTTKKVIEAIADILREAKIKMDTRALPLLQTVALNGALTHIWERKGQHKILNIRLGIGGQHIEVTHCLEGKTETTTVDFIQLHNNLEQSEPVVN